MIRTHKTYFHDINKILGRSKSEYLNVFNLLKSKEPIDVLDIGCRVPRNLFLIYHVFDYGSLIGVDKVNESTCVSNHKEQSLKFGKDELKKENIQKYKSFFDVYSNEITPDEDEKPKLILKENFDKIFLPGFKEIDFLNFLDSDKNKFDLIIASNILHFFNEIEVENILGVLKNKLNEDGLLLIRIQNKSNFDYKKFKESFKKRYVDGEIYEYYENKNKWGHSIVINKNNFL